MSESAKSTDIWDDPEVKAALKEGRHPEDIAVLNCPACGKLGYYNQGSHFYCRFCDKGWYVCTEDEERPRGMPSMVTDGLLNLADATEPWPPESVP